MIDFLEIVHILLFLSLEISMNFLEIVLLILNEFITRWKTYNSNSQFNPIDFVCRINNTISNRNSFFYTDILKRSSGL